MGKYTLLLFKLIFFSAILSTDNMVLANEKIKAIEQENKGKDWIEEIKGEIKAIEQENEGKDWIEELKEEIREVDQERNVKDKISTEKEKKKKVSKKKILKKLERVYQKKESI
ncbi:hypothetical protein [Prochlorococcus marinus]|uniref:Uncharacterized protein n=1 Tax=Prochlorococcus marinus (strain AS9601) TaxID=146891 RepID=A2BSF7_PROMS|nr:hypothetical protein [Prochlorococcus marinus]ABM70718.1 Hypothetical protein A9601_14351 [Prochlorococcus marinus str. AS9601]